MNEKRIGLVTGANKGLGKEIARQLAKLGFHVYMGSRDRGRGLQATKELLSEGLDVVPVCLDVTSDESVATVAQEIKHDHGILDVLVNNAGVLVSRSALEIGAEEMKTTFDTNVFGVVRMIHAMLPLLEASASPRIVNIASTPASLTLASDPTTMFGREDTIVAYASSKAAVTMLTIQYANAFRRRSSHAHIKINAATPGYIA